MDHQYGQFLLTQKSVLEYISEKIDHKKSQNQLKPPSVVNPNFGSISTVPTFYKSSKSHGCSIGYKQKSHQLVGK
jgi:hypothetical protein